MDYNFTRLRVACFLAYVFLFCVILSKQYNDTFQISLGLNPKYQRVFLCLIQYHNSMVFRNFTRSSALKTLLQSR